MPTLTTESIWPITAALGVMFWCFVGIEAFAHMGEEFKNPQRDFPIAIIVGCFVAGATYWACSVVILKFGAYGSAQFDNASIPWLSAHLLGDSAKWLISIIGFSACFASVNLYTQSLSRMVWAQAREHRPNSPLAKISRRGVPSSATVLVGAVLLASCVIGSLSKLDLEFFLKLANSIFCFGLSIGNASCIQITARTRKSPRGDFFSVMYRRVHLFRLVYALRPWHFALLSAVETMATKRHSSIVE